MTSRMVEARFKTLWQSFGTLANASGLPYERRCGGDADKLAAFTDLSKGE